MSVGFTTPVLVGRMALAVLIRLLVGWVGMLPADLPGLKHGGEQRTVARDPSLQTLCLRQFHESRDLFLFLTRTALHAHRSTWHVAGLGSKGGDWVSVWHVTDEWKALLPGFWETGVGVQTRRCSRVWAGRPELSQEPLGRADPGPRPRRPIQRGEEMRQLWPCPWLMRRKNFTPITRPQKLLSEKTAPTRATTFLITCYGDLSSSSSVPWPQAELQTLSRPPSGPQGKLLREWHGNWQVT